ncbi:MAG TPA: hypothetical protein VN816_00875 [Acidimicrobiales bacterium]|nr:hypothetical protein [Acidimicrobiales bacterium]
MTGWEPTAGDSWGGRPIARRIADIAPRRRVVVTGTIVDTESSCWRRWPAYICRFDDDTGSITIVFGGPRPVPGIVKGVLCTVEGTALSNGAGLLLWNPFYRFEP